MQSVCRGDTHCAAAAVTTDHWPISFIVVVIAELICLFYIQRCVSELLINHMEATLSCCVTPK